MGAGQPAGQARVAAGGRAICEPCRPPRAGRRDLSPWSDRSARVIALAYRAALLLAGCLGLLLARRLSRYRPIPLVLLGLFLADLARELPPLVAAWSPRAAQHLDQALALTFPVASAALALRILAGRGAVAPIVLGGVVLVALVAAHPLSADASLLAFGLVHVAAAGAEVGAAVVAWSRGRTAYLPERAAIILVAGDAAGLLGPWLGRVVALWLLGVLQGLSALLVLCYFQIRWIRALRAPAGAS